MAAPQVMAVTGARSGIGKATADALRAAGHRVIGIDLSDCDINSDLSTEEGRDGSVQAVESMCDGRLDAFIACAGLASSDGPAMVSVNYFGAVVLSARVRPLLQAAVAPRVVVVSSSSVLLPSDPELVELCLAGEEEAARSKATDNPLAYASTKLALARWVRRTSISPGWADQGLLLNAVAPGLVRTPMTEPLLASEEGRARLAESAPYATPWMAAPEHIAPLIAFLASDDNRHMVGQVIFCDGGKDAMMRQAAF